MKLLFSNIVALFIIGLCAHDCAAQVASSSGPGKTIEQALSERGIRTDHDSLIAALKGSDQVTQALAANQLASQHAADAAPYILSDFERASESVTRLNLAQAMFVISRTDGLKLMAQICQASKEDGMVRLHASRVVRDASLHNCDQAIVDVASSSEEPSAKLTALSLLDLSMGRTINASEAVALEETLLNDQNNAVRVVAAQALMMSGEPGAKEKILKRLSIEQNSDVRDSLSKVIAESPKQPG